MTSSHHSSSSNSSTVREEEMIHLIHQMSILQRRQSIRTTMNASSSSSSPLPHHDNDSSDSTFASADGDEDDDEDHDWCLQNSTDNDDDDIIEEPSSSSTLNLSFSYASPVRSMRSSISTNDLTLSGGSLSSRRRRRVVSFDSVTYIREYQRLVWSSSTCSTTLNDGKCLLQLSWEHAPTIIGCIRDDDDDDDHNRQHRQQPQRTKKNKKKLFRRLSYQERRARILDVINDLDDIHHNDMPMIQGNRNDSTWQHDDNISAINPPVRISGNKESTCCTTKLSSQLHNAKMPAKRTNSLLSLPPRLPSKPDYSLAALAA